MVAAALWAWFGRGVVPVQKARWVAASSGGSHQLVEVLHRGMLSHSHVRLVAGGEEGSRAVEQSSDGAVEQ